MLVGFIQKRKVFHANDMHAEPPFPLDYEKSRKGYCKRVMTPTAESKNIF